MPFRRCAGSPAPEDHQGEELAVVRTSQKEAGEEIPRARLGITGLDDILGGGLPTNHLYLVDGEPGTGKTTLALQFLLEGVAKGERGLYVTLSESATELSEKLVVLLKDPALRARMGEAALARARERFTVERMGQGTSDVYGRLVEASRRYSA